MKKFAIAVLLIVTLGWMPGSFAQQNISAASLELLNAPGDRDVAHVQRLLDQGANLTAQSSDGTTPLMAAARLGDNADLKLLLDKGAQINLQANYGETALTWALRGYSKILTSAKSRQQPCCCCSMVPTFESGTHAE